MKRRLVAGFAVAALVVLAGCSSGPSGPGTLKGTATATAPQTLGAVVLEVTGSGIQGFEGQQGSVAYGAVVNASTGRYRVVVVGTGPLAFGVKMDNVKDAMPAVQVVQAVDDNNAAISVSGVKVTLTN
jgi:hypothetical protein